MNDSYSQESYYRTYARIDLNAILENFRALKSCLKDGVKALATVKADAYGHGSVPVARVLEKEADYFGVACIEEAITLREGGIQKPILIFSFTHPSQYADLIRYDLTAAIYNAQEAALLSEAALAQGKKAKVHLAVDTGMGRVGLTPDENGAKIAYRIVGLEGIHAEGIFSHYAKADETDKRAAKKQEALFLSFLGLLEKRGIVFSLRHICNSAGSVEMENQFDMCRFGISLYGMYPSDEVDHTRVKLIPAMEVISHVIHVKTVSQGTPIGYGHTYFAPSERKIATVSIGYADGFNRAFSGRGYVLIRGKKAFVTGRVCMDQIMVDVTNIPDVSVGDEAVVLGKSGRERITAEKLGAMAESFHYEVVCNFMPRVTRIYRFEDEK